MIPMIANPTIETPTPTPTAVPFESFPSASALGLLVAFLVCDGVDAFVLDRLGDADDAAAPVALGSKGSRRRCEPI